MHGNGGSGCSVVAAERPRGGHLVISLRNLDASDNLSRLLAVLVFLYAVSLLPLTCAGIAGIHENAMQFAKCYSYEQGRPMEVSDQASRRLDEMQKRLSRRAEDLDADGPTFAGLKTYIWECRAALLEFYRSRSTDWRYYDYSAFYQVCPSFILPWQWLLDRFGVAIEVVSIAIYVANWLGFLSLFLLTRRLTGSNLLALMTTQIPLYLHYFLVFDNTRYFYWRTFSPLYVSVLLAYIGLLLVAPTDKDGLGRFYRLFRDIGLIGALGFTALLTLYLTPNLHRIEPILVSLVVLCGGLKLRSKAIIMRGLASLLMIYLAVAQYNAYGRVLWKPVTNLNHATNDAFVPVSAFWGYEERPGYYALCPSDFSFTFPQVYDPLINDHVPELAVHQSWVLWGRDFLSDILVHRPWMYPWTFGARLFDQLIFLRKGSFGLYDRAPQGAIGYALDLLALSMVFGLVMVSIWGQLVSPGFLPLAALILWNTFGVSTLFTIIHDHSEYMTNGAMMLLCVLPSMAILSWKASIQVWRSTKSLREMSKRKLYVGVVLMIGLFPVVAVAGREANKEMEAWRIWYEIHAPLAPLNGKREPVHTPREIIQHINRIEVLGANEPGTVEMHAAWSLFAWRERLEWYKSVAAATQPGGGPYDWDSYKRDLPKWIDQYYSRAVREGTNSPYIAACAKLLGCATWPEIFRDSLSKRPENLYARYMLNELSKLSLPVAEHEQYLRQFENLEGEFLARTAAVRPGYVRFPACASTPAAASSDEGEKLVLKAGSTVLLAPFPVYNSDRVRMILYVDVVKGAADSSLLLAPSGEDVSRVSMSTQPGEPRYRFVGVDGKALCGQEQMQWKLTAGSDGAELIIRDYYPFVLNPRFFRPDGLLPMQELRQAYMDDCKGRPKPR